MEDKERCICKPMEILIFPCSGGSNVGQISNQAAVALTKNMKGKFFCLAGVGGHIGVIAESTKAAKKLVAIDGCPVRYSNFIVFYICYKILFRFSERAEQK